MNGKIILVGAFHEMIELAEENGYEIVGLIDNEKIDSYRNYKIVCKDNDAINLSPALKLIPLVITPDKPDIRKKLTCFYTKLDFTFSSLLSKECKISKSATIGTGSVIQSGVNVSSECKIGMFVKLNNKCNIMHNSTIGDFTTIAPNAVVLGNVKIGENCYIGANATILPNIKICDDVIVGAGAVVTKDVNSSSILVGNPAKNIKQIYYS